MNEFDTFIVTNVRYTDYHDVDENIITIIYQGGGWVGSVPTGLFNRVTTTFDTVASRKNNTQPPSLPECYVVYYDITISLGLSIIWISVT